MFRLVSWLRLACLPGFIVLFLTGSLATAQSISDGSFELPALTPNTYTLASGSTIPGSPWSFAGTTGVRGISTNGSPFTAQTVATSNGNQVALIQGVGTLTQQVYFPSAGNYQVSLQAILRWESFDAQVLTLAIEVDGVSRWSGQPAKGNYVTNTTPTLALAQGQHTIVLRTTNSSNQDNTVFIDAVSINAVGSNPPPTVSIGVSPSTGLVAPASVTLSATASDANGINRVEFYGDGGFLGSDTTAPYSWSWTGIPAGTHIAMAKAFDSLGASTTASQSISVDLDGGFELPALAAAGWKAAVGTTIPGSPWSFGGTTGSRGISKNGSIFTSLTVPTSDGTQVAFIQGAGTLSQSVYFGSAGNYQVSFKAIQRFENQDPFGIILGIEVDGVSRWSQAPGKVGYFPYATPSFALIAGNHTIVLRGTNPPANDNTVFIDAVSIFSTASNTAPTVSISVMPSTGSVAPASVTLNATASDSGGISRVEFYGDGALLGIDASAPYSWSWTGIAAGSHTALAKAYDNLGVSTSASQLITVSASGNPPPTVSIGVSPSTGLVAPASVTLSATASDANGINRVEFYGDGGFLGSDTTAPYSWSWTGIPAGTHIGMAKAFDSLGASTTASQTISVDSPPTVSISVSPNTGLVAPASVTLSATASDSDGTIAWVEFYGDGGLLGSDTTAPFSWSWTGIPAGTHTAMAKAIDNLGGSTSASQNITVDAPTSGCTINANLSAAGLTTDSSVGWTGCGTAGTGVQTALNLLSGSGTGTLQFVGSGSLLVTSPLYVYSGTSVKGNSAAGPFGTPIVGEARTASCTSGGTYRPSACPIIVIPGQSNVTVTNLDINGDTGGRILAGPAFAINANSNNVTVSASRVVGARQFAITVDHSSHVNLDGLNLLLERSYGSQPEGGAGVWVNQSSYVSLQNSTVSSPQYYNSGPPVGDPNALPGAPGPMDLVAFYGGNNNSISHNTITYGNSAAIYVARCDSSPVCNPLGTRERDSTIWDNTINHMQQHGLDLANCDRPNVVTNRVDTVGDAALSIANCINGNVQFNTFSSSWLNPLSIEVGTVWIYWGSTGNSVSSNNIKGYGGNATYSVMFSSAVDGAYPLSTGNNVFNNDIWAGISGYFGGYGGSLPSNTTSPNTLH